MAKCRSCGTGIPEGSEYCEVCSNKLNTAKDSESYLDSLLNAVMTEEPKSRENVFPKREASSLVSVPKNKEKVVEAAEEPTEEFTEEAEETVEEFSEEAMEELAEEAEAFGEEFAEAFMEKLAREQEELTEAFAEDTEADFVTIGEEDTEEAPMEDTFGLFFDGDTELPDLKNYSIFGDVDESTVDRMLAEELGEAFPDEEDVPEGDDLQEFFGETYEEEEDEDSMSDVGDIEDLFGMLEDERGDAAPKELEIAETPEVISSAELDSVADTFSGIVEDREEEEVVSADEFGDFADLFSGGAEEFEEAPIKSESKSEASMDDFADLFSGLEDAGELFEFGAAPIEMDAPEDALPPVNAMEASEAETTQNDTEAEEKTKKKKGGGLAALYHKLFDNVKVDPSKIKQPPSKEEIEAKKKAKQEEKERSKEEKEALLAEKKAQDKQVKLEKQRAVKEAKAEKKARKLEEAKLLLEEMEKTRINRAGASIVFIFFAMIAVVIIVGTSIFSYSLSIKNAEYEFENDRYTAAYNEIYGLEIKDEDILLYDRIMTVMYVQKQLNSYSNYYGMGDKPKALDSLLKGLQRYEKYIDLAVDLEVDGDLDIVRKKILTEISTSFSMTEQEAMEIIQSDSQAEYSKRVYDAVERLE